MTKGRINLHFGGEIWRPLVDVRDAARAYIALIQGNASQINGEVFNLAYRNFRISELALRVAKALREVDVPCEIDTDHSYKGVRNYRVSGKKLERTLDFRPTISVEESTKTIVREIATHGYTDFDNPRYYNIQWMRLLEESQRIIQVTGSIFGGNSG